MFRALTLLTCLLLTGACSKTTWRMDPKVLVPVRQVALALDDPQMKNLLVEIDEQGREKENIDHQLLLNDLIRAFARRQMEESMRRQQAALDAENLNEQEQLDALLHIMKYKLELMGE